MAMPPNPESCYCLKYMCNQFDIYASPDLLLKLEQEFSYRNYL